MDAVMQMMNNTALWKSHVLDCHAMWSAQWKHDLKKSATILHEAGFTLNARAVQIAIAERITTVAK